VGANIIIYRKSKVLKVSKICPDSYWDKVMVVMEKPDAIIS